MTKEEAKENWMKLYESGFVSVDVEKLIIDKIYDELELKSCEGCIHHKAYHGNFALSCCECSRFYSDNFEEMKK